MTLTQLRYFLAACRFGTFTSAADHLGISQPSLSQQVILLERGLGVSLFVRAGRQLVLTDAGKALLEHASRIVADVDMAATAVGAVRGMEDGTASLGTFGVAYFYFVREVIAEFAARHPGVRMRVVGQNTVEVVELVKSGELEAGLITLPTDTTGLVVRPVM
jgi:DNA-binding transcriptional LysR family regulator